MKKMINIIIVPIIILIFSFLGRCYWYDIAYFVLHAFRWNGDISPSFRSIIGTMTLIISDMAILYYLLYMRHKQKKEYIKFSFLHKILLTIALTLFVEITINGILFTYLGADIGLIYFSLYGFSYVFTIGITILFTFLWILKDDAHPTE